MTRNGYPVAVLSPPDIEEITIRRLIKSGRRWLDRLTATVLITLGLKLATDPHP